MKKLDNLFNRGLELEQKLREGIRNNEDVTDIYNQIYKIDQEIKNIKTEMIDNE